MNYLSTEFPAQFANQKTVEKKEMGQNRIFRKRVLTDSLLAE